MEIDKVISVRIRFLGFVMSCVIATYHSKVFLKPIAKSSDAWWTSVVNGISDQLAVFAMAWFFSVTGYLLFHGLSFENYPKKMFRRLKSLVLPFLIWQIIATISRYFAFGEVRSLSTWLSQVFLLERWPPDGPLWYLWAIFLLAVISPVFLIFFRNRQIGIVFIVLAIIGLFILPDKAMPRSLCVFVRYGCVPNLFSYLPAFLVASYCGYLTSREREHECLPSFCIILVLLWLADVLCRGVFASALPKLLPVLMLYFLPVRQTVASWPILRCSFLVYALHTIVIAFALPVFQNLMVRQMTSVAGITLACKLYCLALTVGLSLVLIRILNRRWRVGLAILTGGR